MDARNFHGVDLVAAIGTAESLFDAVPVKNKKGGVEKTTQALHTLIRGRANAALQPLVRPALDDALENHQLCYGLRDDGVLTPDEWDATLNAACSEMFAPWVPHLSGKWLAAAGKHSWASVDSGLSLASQFAHDLLTEAGNSGALTPAHLAAAVGITQAGIVAFCGQAAPAAPRITGPAETPPPPPAPVSVEAAGRAAMDHLAAIAAANPAGVDRDAQYAYFVALADGGGWVPGTAPAQVMAWAKERAPADEPLSVWLMDEFDQAVDRIQANPMPTPAPVTPLVPALKRSRAKADLPDQAALLGQLKTAEITDPELAETLGVSRAQISNMRNGKARWTPSELERETVIAFLRSKQAAIQAVVDAL